MTTPRLRRRGLARQEAIAFYLFLTPWALGFILWTAGPMIASIVLSFADYNVISPPKFIGLANYAEIFQTSLFWHSLKVTAVYTVGATFFGVSGALLIATLLNLNLPWLSVWRTIYYLPVVTSGVAVALLWSWVLHPNFGLLNGFLWGLFRIRGPGWFFDEAWAVPSFILMHAWAVGGPMLIYLAGMQGVPTELYDAAQIDGANGLQRYRHITLPMISPVILFNTIMSIIASFQVFTNAFVITQGGPNYASFFYVLYLYQNAFQYFRMGYASALAWILFVIVLFFTLLIFRSSRSLVYYEAQGRGL